MPRNPSAPSGADELGLTAVNDTRDLMAAMEGVGEVKQSRDKWDGIVFDFTKPAPILVPTGTEVELIIKGAKIGVVGTTGDPKSTILYEIEGGEYDTLRFFDDLLFMPMRGLSKGTMWRVRAFCAAIKYPDMPSSIPGNEILAWIKQFNEDILGERLKVVMKINTSDKVNPQTGELYDPRNGIGKFLTQSDRTLDDLFNS